LRDLLLCQPAPSTTSATCSSSAIVAAKASRNACMPAVGVRQDQHEIVVGARLDGGVDVGVGVALIEDAPRAFAALPPDVADATFLPDACFVLEIKAETLIVVRTMKSLQSSRGSF